MSYDYLDEIIDVSPDRLDLCPFGSGDGGAGTACQRGCMVCQDGVQCCSAGESCVAPTACLTPCPFVDYYKSCMFVDNALGEPTLQDCSADPSQQGTATNFCTVFTPKNRDELLGVAAQPRKPLTAYQQQVALQQSIYKMQTASTPQLSKLNRYADMAGTRPSFWAYGPQ